MSDTNLIFTVAEYSELVKLNGCDVCSFIGTGLLTSDDGPLPETGGAALLWNYDISVDLSYARIE